MSSGIDKKIPTQRQSTTPFLKTYALSTDTNDNPVRQLLAGQAAEGTQIPRRPRWPIAAIAVWVLLGLAAAAALAATQLSGEPAEVFGKNLGG